VTVPKSNAPTLADACIATALDKRCDPQLRAVLLKVNEARKFVLDKDMSAYFYDLSQCGNPFKRRDVFMTVTNDKHRPIAAASLVTYRKDGFPSRSSFYFECDCASSARGDAAEAFNALYNGRDEDEPFRNGDVIIFEKLVIDAQSSAGVEATWAAIDVFAMSERNRSTPR